MIKEWNSNENHTSTVGVNKFSDWTYEELKSLNGYKTEDYSFLLFYYPKEVLETGEVVFDTVLKKMNINVNNAENIWKKAIKLLNDSCPDKHKHKDCPWCYHIEE